MSGSKPAWDGTDKRTKAKTSKRDQSVTSNKQHKGEGGTPGDTGQKPRDTNSHTRKGGPKVPPPNPATTDDGTKGKRKGNQGKNRTGRRQEGEGVTQSACDQRDQSPNQN